MGASLLSSPLEFIQSNRKSRINWSNLPFNYSKKPLFSAIKTLLDVVLTKITTLKLYNMWKICIFAKKL